MKGRRMLTRLDRLVDEIAALHSKLILLVGRLGCGKTALMAELANRRAAKVMNIGAALGKRLAALPTRRFPVAAMYHGSRIAPKGSSTSTSSFFPAPPKPWGGLEPSRAPIRMLASGLFCWSWWRRGESNPRPRILRSQAYMLSRVYWVSPCARRPAG